MNHKLTRLLCAMLIAIMMMSVVCVPALAAQTVKINTTTKVYKSPSKSAKSVKVKSSLKVTLKGTSGGWAKISYKGRTGYIPIKYLNLNKAIKVYVKDQTAKVYQSPGKNQIATVTLGTTLYYVGKSGNYARVQNSAGKTRGYVKASALSTTKPSADDWKPGPKSTSFTDIGKLPSNLISDWDPDDDDDSTEAVIEKVIYIAQSKMGAPYVARKKGPNQFDCAGFTYYCYKKGAGIKLSGSSKGQGYDTSYDKVDADELERGDLVCFDTDESDGDLSDHVGIYMGDGYFIHASSAAGQVIISRLDEGYYERVFSWGRRIIE